jgi:hypothetical protein
MGVPRESKGIAVLAVALILWWMILGCGTTGVAWDSSIDELVEINNWLIVTEDYLCENDGCNTAKWLWDMFDLVVNAQSPDAEGRLLNGMMNLLWEHPDLQNDFHNLIVEVKGKAWVTAWMGTAYVVDLAGRWVTVWGMVGMPSYCEAWCDSIPSELWTEIPPPPNCYCGGQEMM